MKKANHRCRVFRKLYMPSVSVWRPSLGCSWLKEDQKLSSAPAAPIRGHAREKLDPSPSQTASQPFLFSFISLLFYINVFILNWNIMAFNIVLVSAKRQDELAICIPMPPPSEPDFHFTPHPTPLGCYRAQVWIPWVIQQIPIGYFTYSNVYVSMLLTPLSHPLFPPPNPPYVCSHCLCLHFYHTNRFINTIFLDSTYMC